MEHTPSPAVATAPARAGLHARRAAAARRRALLTVSLLVLTAATGALAATTPVSSWFVLLPAALLGAVLVLGRRAVLANARADAAWEARERARRADAASDDVRLAGRPAPAVRPRVTGRAVKSSQSQTQMIARVRLAGAVASPAGDSAVEPAPAAGTATKVAEASEGTSAQAEDAPVALVAPASAAPGDTAAGKAAEKPAEKPADKGAAKKKPAEQGSDTAAASTEWTAVPVPRPVYTMKSAAPRWEPAPLTAEMAQITQARRAELAAGDAERVAQPVAEQTGGASLTLHESEAPSDSLGVNLNSVLARRRAAGE